MYTIDNLIAQTRSLLGAAYDNGLLEDEFIEDRLKKDIFPKFKNRETWIPYECHFTICDQKVELPCSTSELISVDLLDTDNEKILYSFYLDRNYTYRLGFQNKQNNNPKYGAGFYDLYGRTIKFYKDTYNGYRLRVRFFGYLTDCDGNIVLPENCAGAAIKYAASEWLATTGIRENLILADRYERQAINQRNLQKGQANRASEPEWREISAINTPDQYVNHFWGGYRNLPSYNGW